MRKNAAGRTCTKCPNLRIPGQRVCLACHAEYMRRYRKVRTERGEPCVRPMYTECSKCMEPKESAPSSYCIPCRNAYANEWRKAHPVTGEAKMKAEARNTSRIAIRLGHIKRGPCIFCGTSEKMEAHHEDYSKPLDIVWVCRAHHRDVTRGRLRVPVL